MRICSCQIQGFRNIESASLTFHPRYNVICGDNAQGKTNLMEALWLFTGGRDFKGSRENDLIRQGETAAKLALTLENSGGEKEMTLTLEKGRRRAYTVGGVPRASGAEVVGNLYAVVFSPAHLSLLQSGPEERRKFLDSAICPVSPTYLRALADYRKVLAQRNALLKDARINPEITELLEVFDPQLAKIGTYLIQVRRSYLERLMTYAAPFYQGISGGSEELSSSYLSVALNAGEKEEDFLLRLRETRDEDLRAMNTSLGPHRDDVGFSIDGMEARRFASQGQQRSVVLAMKLAESRILGDMTGESPVVLLDDVMSELDASRKEYLLGGLEQGQIFITGCDPAFFSSFSGAFFHTENGTFVQEG